jgi:tetratricopeptide (TPR) repeat protein
MREKDYQDCYQAYIKALGYAPDSPVVHNALGDALEQLNLHQESLAEYEAAERLSPGDSGPIIGHATALCGLKRYANAETMMRALVAKAPKDAASHTGLAETLDAAGKHDAAIAEYKAALAITPDDAYLWGNMGWAYYNAGKYDDSISASRKALTMDKTLAYVMFNIGLADAVLDKSADAEKEYDAAIAIAAAADIHAGIGDLKDAEKKHATPLIQQLITRLSAAEWKALGLPSDLTVNGH